MQRLFREVLIVALSCLATFLLLIALRFLVSQAGYVLPTVAKYILVIFLYLAIRQSLETAFQSKSPG